MKWLRDPQEIWSDDLPEFCEEYDYHQFCYKKGGGSAPAAPDPAATAAAQAQANKEAVLESAKVNQYNQVTPYGTVSWTGEIGSPNRTQTLKLDPSSQSALDAQNNVSKGLSQFAEQFVPRVAQGLSAPFSTASVGQAPEYDENSRQRIETALMDRLQPQIDRDQSALNTQLANQGIGIGSQAYSDAQRDFNTSVNDARLSAISQAGVEAANDFSLQQQGYNQKLSNALLDRTQGLNEVAALIQGSPAINTPQLPQSAQYQIAAPDVIGANQLAYQGQLAGFNNQQANSRAAMGGLASLGAAGISLLSDIRAKTDIKRVGKTDSGLGVYTYRYKGEPTVHMGVMAQEVEKVNPAAVTEINGLKHVNYGEI